ncbi:rab-GTPase-TBC domain-containing protein [Paraphysoderma sedebokerense]|nr:rab-GTPase-TBC domain-containing protein [Paraphysoderma sedebokerense]
MLNQQKSSIRPGRAPSEQLSTSVTSSPKPPSSFIPLTSYSKYRYVNQRPSPSHSKSTSPPPQTSAYFPSYSSTKSKLKPKLALSIDRHSAPSSTATSLNPSASQTTANSTTTSPKSSRIKSASPSVSSSLRQRFESILSTSNYSERELKDSLTKLRKLILTEGIPDDDQDDIPTSTALRCRVWKVLLGIHHISTKEYLNLISKGESEVYQKIRNDTFRTLATDKKFLKNVNESMLIRLLNSFVWAAKALSSPSSPNPFAFKFSYVQGQNVISAPFLYVMPEVEAFYSYSSFVYNHCPLYVQPALEGVHCGLKLLEKCLKVLDPKLYYCLKKKNLSAELYAFPSVLTFCACTPPLSEVLKLWDFLISYGIHLNVLCVIAQLLLIRDDILKSERPMKLLRTFPPLNAKSTITIAVSLVKQLPNDLYDLLVRHPWDRKVLEIMGVGNLGNSSTTNGNGNETTNGNPVQKQKIEVTKDQNKTTKSSVLGTMKTQGHGHGTIRNSEIGLESTPSKAEINDSREDFIQVDDDEEW